MESSAVSPEGLIDHQNAMATSRKEPHQPNASRTNRGVRNMSPVLKPRGEPDAQGILRRARSVPSSPDRRSSASATASSSSSSSNACRPSSSFNPRSTASSRSSSASGSSASSSSSASTHGKAPLLHSVSSMVGAKQAAGVMRRRADKSTAGATTSVRPHTSPDKDAASKPAKSLSSNVQKSKIPTRPGGEKTAAAAAPSPKPRTQKATGAGAAGKTPSAASSSARNIPGGATAKRRPAGTTEISVVPSIRRTTSVPVPAAPKAAAHQESDVDDQLLMEEFDETESISTPSIEEHLQQRLPDPVDVVVTAFTATTSEPHVNAPTPSEEPSISSSREEEHENDQEAVITEHMTIVAEEKHEHLNGGDDADVAKEAAAEIVDDDVELLKKEAAESNEAEIETGSVGNIDQLKGDVVDESTTKSNEADGEETELQQAVDGEAELKDHPELLTVKKEAEDEPNEERTVLPATKTAEAVQRMRTNEVTEEGGSRSKTAAQERRNKVMALVGRFETALSGSGRE